MQRYEQIPKTSLHKMLYKLYEMNRVENEKHFSWNLNPQKYIPNFKTLVIKKFHKSLIHKSQREIRIFMKKI
jgi:hypothetical protein